MHRGRRARWVGILTLLGLLVACGGGGAADPGYEQQVLPEFMFGTSQGGHSVLGYVEELGATWMRTQVTWRQVEPVVESVYLTVADVDADPSLVSDYIARGNWTYTDDFIAAMHAADISPLVILGHGYKHSLPTYEGARLSPDAIGTQHYLGHLYLLARATVERYDGDGIDDAPGGQTVKLWQLENELNQAFLTAVWGWREPAFGDAQGSAWQDWEFVTDILRTLEHAVRVEDPDASTMVNFHTDIPDNLNGLFSLPTWEESIELWLPYVDIVGIDSYPNYYRATPVRGTVLGDRVQKAMAKARGKPVIVVETGYPTGPTERGYTEEQQATYIHDAYTSAVEAGAQGFLLFGVKTSESHSVVITQHDLDELDHLADLYEQDNALALLLYANDNQAYIENQLVHVLQSVEPYWGLVRQDGTHKPGWNTFLELGK